MFTGKQADSLNSPVRLALKRFVFYLKKCKDNSAVKDWSRRLPEFDIELKFKDVFKRYPDTNDVYKYFHKYFIYHCPQCIRGHRLYFSQNERGFGEGALHTMWWLLFLEYKPCQCLEIGVFRGQVISLWALISKYLNYPCDVRGISPFTNRNDSTTTYADMDYYNDVLSNFSHFGLPRPYLVRSLSTDPAAQREISSRLWDLVYIDGSHDYEIVLADFRICKQYLKTGGILVLDDAALFTEFRPPPFSFAGHPGPSRVASDFAMKEMCFLGGVAHNLIFEKL